MRNATLHTYSWKKRKRKRTRPNNTREITAVAKGLKDSIIGSTWDRADEFSDTLIGSGMAFSFGTSICSLYIPREAGSGLSSGDLWGALESNPAICSCHRRKELADFCAQQAWCISFYNSNKKKGGNMARVSGESILPIAIGSAPLDSSEKFLFFQ